MQDRYAADIGDFGKFKLLRYLFLDTHYTLCQLWFMYPNETHNNDGMYIDYFKKVENTDLILENSFKNIIQTRRDVKALEEANLLTNIVYFNDILQKDKKLEFRKSWFEKALSFSKEFQIVLTDSDNGIATKSFRDSKDIIIQSYEDLEKKDKSGKYIFFDEIKHLYQSSEAIVVYHHLNRCFSHDEQIQVLLKKLQKDFKKVLAIKHKPYSPRVYFFICKQENIYNFFMPKLQSFESKYSHHWKLFL